MQKSSYKIGLVWAIIAFAFAVVAGALFFFAPMVDQAMGLNELVGLGYEPLTLLVGGIMNLVSFNFAQPGYLFVFALALLLLSALIYWGVMIAVKKLYKRYIALLLILLAGVVSLFIASAYILTPCNPATLLGGEVLTRYVYKDLLNDYATMRVQDGESAPFVFNNVTPMVMGFGVAIFGFATFFIAFVKSLVDAIVLGCPSKEERELARAEEERRLEERRAMIAEIEEKRRAELLAYVDYAANKPLRQEEYEKICAEAGVKPEPTREQARYNEVLDLPFFKDKDFVYKKAEEVEEATPLPEEDDDEAYYRETAKDLAILRGERNEIEEPVKEVEPEVVEESDEEYYARLAKELPILGKQELKRPAKEPEEDLLALKVAEELIKQQKYEEAVAFVKQRALEGDTYYKTLEKELRCLQYQKPPVTPEVE